MPFNRTRLNGSKILPVRFLLRSKSTSLHVNLEFFKLSTTPVNLYGESHAQTTTAPAKSDKPGPLTDPFLLAQVLGTSGHPSLNLLNGTEYNPKQPASTGFWKERKISVKEVLHRLRTNNESFVFGLNDKRTRVRWVRSVRWRIKEIGPWTESFRTGGNYDEVGAALLPPSPEWIRRMNANNSSGTGSMIFGKREKPNVGFSIKRKTTVQI